MSWARHGHPTETGSAWSDAHKAYEASRLTQDRQAARVVAGQATGLQDCSDLLEMLGLDAKAIRPA
jgi:type II secretory pathway component PulL